MPVANRRVGLSKYRIAPDSHLLKHLGPQSKPISEPGRPSRQVSVTDLPIETSDEEDTEDNADIRPTSFEKDTRSQMQRPSKNAISQRSGQAAGISLVKDFGNLEGRGDKTSYSSVSRNEQPATGQGRRAVAPTRTYGTPRPLTRRRSRESPSHSPRKDNSKRRKRSLKGTVQEGPQSSAPIMVLPENDSSPEKSRISVEIRHPELPGESLASKSAFEIGIPLSPSTAMHKTARLKGVFDHISSEGDLDDVFCSNRLPETARRSPRLRNRSRSPEPSKSLPHASILYSPGQGQALNSDALPEDNGLHLVGGLGMPSERAAANRCPYCNDEVDEAFLKTYSRGKRMNIKKQRSFCVAHKKAQAIKIWKAKGYPDIQWKTLATRMRAHHGFLRKIIEGSSSHYGRALARDIKAGKNRNLLKDGAHVPVGYYGPRGFRLMQENIFGRFSTQIRERAVEDGLVSARGYSLYVQAVLVPELAARLVMEDLDADADRARAVLDESTWIGDLLSEDVEDSVLVHEVDSEID